MFLSGVKRFKSRFVSSIDKIRRSNAALSQFGKQYRQIEQ